MQFKTDTKEKFHAITVFEPTLTGSMTEELGKSLRAYLQNDGIGVKNVILNLSEVANMEEEAAEKLLNLQQDFYEQQTSFVICSIQKPVQKFLETIDILELLNWTPTESEAWDIVQMEEIERDLD